MKKILAILLAAIMLLGLVACTPETDEPAVDEPAAKEVINLWSFTDEIPGMVTRYMELNPEFAEKYEVKTTIIATTDGLYQPALDAALLAGGEDAPDLYAAEAAFILKYSQGEASGFAAAYEDLGIDLSQIKSAEIAQYSVDLGTRPDDGKVVALGYQATGGAMIYRATIAEEVFGTSDPAEIEAIVGGGSGNWDKFWEAAATLKDAGYPIVSGDGDVWHAVENSSSAGWVDGDKLVISPEREAFFDISKNLYDNGWSNRTTDWQEGWFNDMKGTSETPAFCFFGPGWLLNYSMHDQVIAEGAVTNGDWRVCTPPVGFFWGGTWLLANKDTEQAEGVAEIINWITLDASENGLQYHWANGTLNGEGGTKDVVASGKVMAASNGEVEICGGQDMFPAFIAGNAYANGKCLTQYDERINALFREQVTQYAIGEKDKDAAIADFKTNVADELGLSID